MVSKKSCPLRPRVPRMTPSCSSCSSRDAELISCHLGGGGGRGRGASSWDAALIMRVMCYMRHALCPTPPMCWPHPTYGSVSFQSHNRVWCAPLWYAVCGACCTPQHADAHVLLCCSPCPRLTCADSPAPRALAPVLTHTRCWMDKSHLPKQMGGGKDF